MSQGQGRGFGAAAKAELWDRWQRGESLKAIGRAFDIEVLGPLELPGVTIGRIDHRKNPLTRLEALAAEFVIDNDDTGA